MRNRRRQEEGHLMVGVVALVAIMMILMTVAFQKWDALMRRENEKEMIFRGEEIARAIFLYQQDKGSLPLKLEDLMEPSDRTGRYFLRRMYDDPLVPDGKWGLLFAAPGGALYDPNAPQAGVAEEVGGISKSETKSVGGLQGGFEQGPRESGGLAIAGVKSLCTDNPFQVRKGIADYSKWLFTVYDLQTLQVPGAGNRPGQPPGGPQARPGGTRQPVGGVGNRGVNRPGGRN